MCLRHCLHETQAWSAKCTDARVQPPCHHLSRGKRSALARAGCREKNAPVYICTPKRRRRTNVRVFAHASSRYAQKHRAPRAAGSYLPRDGSVLVARHVPPPPHCSRESTICRWAWPRILSTWGPRRARADTRPSFGTVVITRKGTEHRARIRKAIRRLNKNL